MPLTSTAAATCTHCGQPAPGAPSDGPAFCCAGCRTVYEVLGEAGLGDFYRLRAQFDEGADGPATSSRPQADISDRYRHFDDPRFVAEHTARPGEIDLRLTGLHCAACVWVLEKLPQALPGVRSSRVDYGSSRLQLRWDPAAIELSRIATFLDQLGYPPHVLSAHAEGDERRRSRAALWRLAVTGALAGNVMLASLALYAGELSSMDPGFVTLFEGLGLILAVPAVTWGALPFYRGAWQGLRLGVLHMDLPISIGIAVGFLASAWGTSSGSGAVYYDTITILVFLLLLGRHLQSWGQARVRTRVELMHALAPGSARRRTDAGWESVYTGALDAGDRILVRGGETIPADGRVELGRGHVDLSMLTGESRPIPLIPGSPVFAGTTNLESDFEMVVERVGGQTRLGRIVERIVERSDAAPVVRLADRISGWFVAAVLGLAAAGGAIWWQLEPSRAFDVVVALLVVSCPCALGLATPMALSVARGKAARAGILVRSATALETLARTETVVIDKTGTVTEGRMRVTEARGFDPEVASIVAALEARSTHPVARALVAFAVETGSETPTVELEDFAEVPGRGLQARFGSRWVRIGSTQWLGVSVEHDAFVTAALARAQTPICVQIGDRNVAMVAIGDRVRLRAAQVLFRIRASGRRIVLASGDHPQVVEAVAAGLPIDACRGGLSPEDKAALLTASAPAVMVGDGINDAIALRAAAVGVAVRGGAEAALEVADVYLAGDDLRSLADLFDGARRTLATIRRNLGLSLVYNVVFASLALAGMITPLVAAILMPLSSLSVIASSAFAKTFGDATSDGPASSAPSMDRGASLSAAEQRSPR